MQVVGVDTTQIQSYIFGSNRLRENIGASHLVAAATGEWAFASLKALGLAHNLGPGDVLDPTRRLENGDIDAEVLYAGGGNVVLLFAEAEKAQAFARHLSRRAMAEAPGLHLVIARQPGPFDWHRDALSQAVAATFQHLRQVKLALPGSNPPSGLAVTRACQSTGLPAVGIAEAPGGDYPASAATLAKRDAVRDAEGRLRAMLGRPGFDFPTEFEHMGRSMGEHSYLAVVHSDGDGLGDRIQAIASRHPHPHQNRAYITDLRAFSTAVDQSAREALQATLGALCGRVQDGCIAHPNPAIPVPALGLKRAEGTDWLLPFRPLVFGGDDVTFICDGRLGLSLAVEYLHQFEARSARLLPAIGQEKLTACAGIAIIKVRYPFARAYAMAEALCRSAKGYRRDLARKRGTWRGSCLDWHWATTGLTGGLESIRQREYRVNTGWLTLRPLALAANPMEPARGWDVVSTALESFQGQDWAGRHNKLKGLRAALREGKAAVDRFRVMFRQELPELLPEYPDLAKCGWLAMGDPPVERCGYFDAVEMSDWHLPLA